jgi:ABC-type cobalt transport system substrate-binding protein
MILTMVARHTAGMITSIAGLALIVFSWLSGAEFLGSGDNGFSLRMALGFIGAFVAYVVGYYLARPRTEKQSI